MASHNPPPPDPSTSAQTEPTVALYVGDLDREVTDIELFNLFSQSYGLISVKVCYDHSTGAEPRSLGYGYVNFYSRAAAAEAIAKFNNTVYRGKTIRVTWSRRDPDARRSGIGNVFVKNLHETINNANLHSIFSRYGDIQSCKVAASDDGKSKGFGFVQFESESAAASAIENLNGSEVQGKQIYVGKFVNKKDRILHGSPDSKFTNLYVKNFDQEITEEILHEVFSEFGTINSLVILRNGYGVSKKFGFVNFDNPDDAKRALETLNGSEQLGTGKLYVARAQKKVQRQQVLRLRFEDIREQYRHSNLYVRNIVDSVSEDELRELFGRFGTIESSRLMIDERGFRRGFGFVCFSTPEQARQAIHGLHGYKFHGKPLYVAIAERKTDRDARLKAEFARLAAERDRVEAERARLAEDARRAQEFYNQYYNQFYAAHPYYPHQYYYPNHPPAYLQPNPLAFVQPNPGFVQPIPVDHGTGYYPAPAVVPQEYYQQPNGVAFQSAERNPTPAWLQAAYENYPFIHQGNGQQQQRGYTESANVHGYQISPSTYLANGHRQQQTESSTSQGFQIHAFSHQSNGYDQGESSNSQANQDNYTTTYHVGESSNSQEVEPEQAAEEAPTAEEADQ